MSRVRAVLLALIAAPTLATLLSASPASAAAPVPPDVIAAYTGAAAWVQQAFEGDPVLEAATGVRDIVEVYSFTPDYLHGKPGPAVESSGSWTATIINGGGTAIGTLTVWRPDGGAAEIAGGSAQVIPLDEIGAARYIEEPMTGSAYLLRGDTLTPFNDNALTFLPKPASLAAFQPVIAKWVSDAIDAADDVPPNYNYLFFGGALALSTIVGVMVVVQRRRLEKLGRQPV